MESDRCSRESAPCDEFSQGDTSSPGGTCRCRGLVTSPLTLATSHLQARFARGTRGIRYFRQPLSAT